MIVSYDSGINVHLNASHLIVNGLKNHCYNVLSFKTLWIEHIFSQVVTICTLMLLSIWLIRIRKRVRTNKIFVFKIFYHISFKKQLTEHLQNSFLAKESNHDHPFGKYNLNQPTFLFCNNYISVEVEWLFVGEKMWILKIHQKYCSNLN